MADNKTIQKVFGLSEYRKQALAGNIPERTRETYREYGYFGGGGDSGPLSTVDRIDYSNDTATASVRGPLSAGRYRHGGVGNSNFGYFVSGRFVPTNIDRIDYSNDSATASVRGVVFGVRWNFASVGNSNFGYFGGGNLTNAVNIISVVERIDYSNDIATASRRGSLSLGRGFFASTGNSNFGYFGGGSPGGSIVDRIDYSNDTTTPSVRGSLSSARTYLAATGNSNFGYFTNYTNLDRIDYSNDSTTASVRGPLSSAKIFLSATGNSNFGYFGGAGPGPLSTVDRIDYSNDSATASVRGPLSSAKIFLAATSSHNFGGSPNSSFASNFTFPTVPNAGYFGGGSDGTNDLASIDKVDYANDTATASVRSALSLARNSLAATGNSNFGYFGGGFPGPVSTVDRIEYSSDTQNAILRGPLSLARGTLAASGNTNFGYYIGGYNPSTAGSYSTIDRIDYSTDNSNASQRGSLTLERSYLTATGNSNFGYIAGGLNPGGSSSNAKSEIQRLDYSIDTLNTLVRSALTANRYVLASSSNSNFGYFGGGHFPASISFSNVSRLDYANDTQTISARGNLSVARGRVSATGTSNFGFFGSGTTIGNPSGNISSTDRINYSNDTAVASIRGPLSTAKSNLAATSPLAYGGAPIYFTNPLPQVFQDQIEFDDSNTLDLPFKRVLGSYGYFGGGAPGARSTVDRIDYSNDTQTALVRGPLSLERNRSGATGNSNFGYFGGGFSVTTYSTIDRIDYSNDIQTLVQRCFLSGIRGGIAATTNFNFGYFVAGYLAPLARSTVDRIDYSNDTATASVRGPLSLSKWMLAASGNSNFGYYGGGKPGPVSSVDRIDYSNDSATASVRGPLSSARSYLTATGNSNFGYFGGGTGPLSTVDRIDYSNDTQTASVRGPLSLGRRALVATGNSNFGYFGGGFVTISTVDRINYSNDTSTASVRGPLSLGRHGLAATTNARNS